MEDDLFVNKPGGHPLRGVQFISLRLPVFCPFHLCTCQKSCLTWCCLNHHHGDKWVFQSHAIQSCFPWQLQGCVSTHYAKWCVAFVIYWCICAIVIMSYNSTCDPQVKFFVLFCFVFKLSLSCNSRWWNNLPLHGRWGIWKETAICIFRGGTVHSSSWFTESRFSILQIMLIDTWRAYRWTRQLMVHTALFD